jgi:GR25 family glycosyltransferase involved in LPS biosynthesis
MPSIKNERIIWIVILVTIIIVCVIFNKSEGFSGIDDAQNPFDKVDIIYYINLDHRTDRNREMLGEFAKMGIPKNKIVRISATKDAEYGDLGCSKSHVNTLKQFVKSNKSNCIVFEDDFEFSQSKEVVHKSLNSLFDQKVKYDVCMLSANTIEKKDSKYPFLKKVINSQTASGYLVNRTFADELLRNFEEGARILETKKNKKDPDRGNYCVDQYWKRLMPESEWYEFSPRLGKQRKSHSDIQGGVVEYGV